MACISDQDVLACAKTLYKVHSMVEVAADVTHEINRHSLAVCIRVSQIALHIDAGHGLVEWGVWVSRLRLSKPYETYGK